MSDAQLGVIMPVFNGEKHVANGLRSLLRESAVGLEIVVVDDGSADASREIVRGIALEHPCVRLLEVDHGGVSRARNAGLAALGERVSLVSYLDCDDLNPPGRLQRQVKAMNEHPEVGCVVGLLQIFEDEDAEQLLPRAGSRTVTVRGVSLSAAVFRRTLLTKLGSLAEDMRYGEDTDFYLRMLEAGTPYLAEDEVAVFYRRHGANATNDVARTRAGFIDAIRRSLGRRRSSGVAVGLGDLFKARSEAERLFSNE